jgi:hypothetical protein
MSLRIFQRAVRDFIIFRIFVARAGKMALWLVFLGFPRPNPDFSMGYAT